MEDHNQRINLVVFDRGHHAPNRYSLLPRPFKKNPAWTLCTKRASIQNSLKWISVPKLSLCIAIISILFIGLYCFWDKYVKALYIPRNFGIVEDKQIYRSGEISPYLIKKTLLKYKIKAIISLSGESELSFQNKTESETARELGVERKVFYLKGDGTGDLDSYARSIAAIWEFQKEGKSVLVHCQSGKHRTGAVIAAYRLLVQNKDIDFVRDEMINYGFDPKGDARLRIFLNNNMEKLASLLSQMGIIEKIPVLSAARI